MSLNFTVNQIRPIEVYKEAWEMLREQYWILFVVTLLGLILGSVIPIIIAGPMMCGIYLCFFQALRGEKVELDRLFKGFDFFLPSLIVMLLVSVPVLIVVVAFYVPFIIMMISGPKMSEAEMIPMLIVFGAVELVIIFIMVCVHTLLVFSIPLIVEYRLSAWESIKTSARAVLQNLPGIVGLMCVGFVVAIISYLALCVGIYFALPLILASNVIAYRKIFPEASSGFQTAQV